MRLGTAVLLALILLAPAARADEKERAIQLRKEIAALRAQLAEKEKELAKIDPVKAVLTISVNDIEPNTVGQLGTYATLPNGKAGVVGDAIRVEKILDKNRFIGTLLLADPTFKGKERPAKQKLLVSNYDTGTAVDGKILTGLPVFRVVGPEKIDGVTYVHLERWTGEYVAPKK